MVTEASPQPMAEPEATRGTRPRRRILFVDGDPEASQEFGRLLHQRSHSWQVAAANNAAEALERLEGAPFEAVVASARLPGRSGVELLNEVGRRFGKLVRVIRYTAEEDKPLLRGFVGWPPSHLTRAMDAGETEAGMEAAFQVAEWMNIPAVNGLLPHMVRLPTVPELYTKVVSLLNSPHASIEDVGELIAKDPALTVKMLQIVNSAAFALGRSVTSAVEAVMFLGTERTKALILVAHTSLHYNLSACRGFSQDQFWRHAVATATLARQIMWTETLDAKLADEAFTAGLLHDVGKLLFAANLTEKYSEMLAVARTQKMGDAEAEQLAFGTTHAELGACLLGTWGLPLDFLRAVAWHQTPSKSGQNSFSVLTAVHVANAFDHGRNGTVDDASMLKLDRHYLARLGLTERWMRWRELGLTQALAE